MRYSPFKAINNTMNQILNKTNTARLLLVVLQIHIIAFFLIFVGCIKNPHNEAQNKLVKVKIPVSTKSGFKLKVVPLYSVDDVGSMNGRFTQFLFAPNDQNGQLSGFKAKTHLSLNSRNEFIAQDTTTLQMMTLAYHLENLAYFDESIGLLELNKWPRKIGINTKFIVKNDPQNTLQENNALYSSKFDAMMFVPYSLSGMPLVANGAVIAHEHFHSLFRRLVMEKISSDKVKAMDYSLHLDPIVEYFNFAPIKLDPIQREFKIETTAEDTNLSDKDQYVRLLLRAYNEGLADFWGWLYSGDPQFLAKSFNKAFSDSRRMDLAPLKIPQKDVFFKNAKMNGFDVGYAYSHAVQVSRFMRSFSMQYQARYKVSTAQMKADMALWVVEALKKMSDDLLAMDEKTWPETDFLLQSLLKTNVSKDKESIDYLKSFTLDEKPNEK